jgi:hypothetical protein
VPGGGSDAEPELVAKVEIFAFIFFQSRVGGLASDFMAL